MSRFDVFRRWFWNFVRKDPDARTSTNPNAVKAQLPRSSFRKTGPGVRKQLKRALWSLTPEQREVAKAKGWDKGLL